MLSEEDAAELLRQFPQVEFAFAYGSGVVQQSGYDYSKDTTELPMLDLVLVVDDSESWHRLNMAVNPSHYTSLISLGASKVAFVQENFQARFWFNTYVSAGLSSSPGRLMKYGVISKKHALEDLHDWSSLYLAGRLHKPVHVLKNNEDISAAMETNRISALSASLLQLPKTFSAEELYREVAGLSYTGDPRMSIGENPNKVANLVHPILPHYVSLYESALSTVGPIAELEQIQENKFSQKISIDNRVELMAHLPLTLQHKLGIPVLPNSSSAEVAESLHHWRNGVVSGKVVFPSSSAVRKGIASIVGQAASTQTAKGLFTIGPKKAFSYALAKIAKRFLK